METAIETRLNWGSILSLRSFYRAFLLCASLFLLWYVVMLLISWYDPTMHLLATFSSAITVGTGNGDGIIEKLIK
jgi:hypothetical protein